MHEERIQELNTGLEQHSAEIAQFLALANMLYTQFNLIGEVHSKINGENVSFSLFLMDRPSPDVTIVKEIFQDGSSTPWEVKKKPQ